jgi:hypothetical protein
LASLCPVCRLDLRRHRSQLHQRPSHPIRLTLLCICTRGH